MNTKFLISFELIKFVSIKTRKVTIICYNGFTFEILNH